MVTTDEKTETVSGPHWVLLETGSNQKYIFSTTKQRFQVAASAEIWTLGYEWVQQACEEVSAAHQASESCELPYLGEATNICERYGDSGNKPLDHQCIAHIVKASGKAYLLVPSEDIGKEIIRKVTYRAVDEHSGIDVWGVVSEPLKADLSDAGDRLTQANAALEQQRYKRLSPDAANGLTPFHARCEYSGGSAAYLRREPDSSAKLVSPTVAFLERNVTNARKRMEEKLLQGLEPKYKAAVIDTENLDTGIVAESWVGVIHADGNGVGKIFMNWKKIFQDGNQFDGPAFVIAQARLSRDLEEITWKSFRETLAEIFQNHEEVPVGVVLPIVVGGDDVVVTVSGKYAFEFAATLTRKFQEIAENSDQGQEFRKMFEKIRQASSSTSPANVEASDSVDDHALEYPQDAQRLSMAAGLLLTKKKHPFHHSVDVAESLTSLAKSVTRAESSMALHVLYEPALRSLSQLREDATILGSQGVPDYCYLAKPVFTARNGSHYINRQVEDGTTKEWVESIQELYAMRYYVAAAEETTDDTETTGSSARVSRGTLQNIRAALTEANTVAQAKIRLDAAYKRAAELTGSGSNLGPSGTLSLNSERGSSLFITAMELEAIKEIEANSTKEDVTQ